MEEHVCISKGNTKMGSLQSVSLPSIITCRKCECNTKCYARKIERLRPNVAKSYQRNLRILRDDPEKYWREVEAAIMTSRFFRFHVSGDIINLDYLYKMIEIAARHKQTEILCFTKQYEIVNKAIDNYREICEDALVEDVIPKNLHIIFSGWPELNMVNPYNFPEAHVRFKDGSTTASANAYSCGGNCTECAMAGCGCWNLKSGEQIVFDEH